LIHTPVSLFRFSALTFNAHKIHYALPWCRDVEGHRNLVVHGPLNLIHILDLWRDTRPKGSFELPKSIKYRATSPVYAEEAYCIVLEDKPDGRSEVKLWTSEGKVGMEADIQAFD
jgi:hydroxyacyl-ACP dehydratase HTD2-like protein with hotdog domain